MDSDLKSILPEIHIRPFPSRQITYSGELGNFSRAYTNCPKCGNTGDLYAGKNFDMRYCPGNMPVEHICRDMLNREHTHPNNCAGVSVEHHHVFCKVCEFIFFFNLPDLSEDKPWQK